VILFTGRKMEESPVFDSLAVPFGAKMVASEEGSLGAMCRDSQELRYDMLWQGAPEDR